MVTLTISLLPSLSMFPAAGVLVLLLYLLLLHELLSNLWWTDNSSSSQKTNSSTGASLNYSRPKTHSQTPRRNPHTLDSLWRRMKQATDSFKMSGLNHALITSTMAEARVEARRIEQERLLSTMAMDR